MIFSLTDAGVTALINNATTSGPGLNITRFAVGLAPTGYTLPPSANPNNQPNGTSATAIQNAQPVNFSNPAVLPYTYMAVTGYKGISSDTGQFILRMDKFLGPLPDTGNFSFNQIGLYIENPIYPGNPAYFVLFATAILNSPYTKFDIVDPSNESNSIEIRAQVTFGGLTANLSFTNYPIATANFLELGSPDQLISPSASPVNTYLINGQSTSIIPGAIQGLGHITGGTLYTNGTYSGVSLTVNSGTVGSGATANITVFGNAVTAVTIVNSGSGYDSTSVLTCPSASIGGTGSGFLVNVYSVSAPFGLDDQGNAMIATAIDENFWSFSTHVAPIVVGTVGSATSSSITSTDIGTYLSSNININGSISGLGTITGGTGYYSGGSTTFYNVPFYVTSGTQGFGATANITITSGIVTAIALVNVGTNYDSTSVLSIKNSFLGGTGSAFSVPVSSVAAYGRYILIFTSGAHIGVCRLITSSSANTVSWNSSAGATASTGDTFKILVSNAAKNNLPLAPSIGEMLVSTGTGPGNVTWQPQPNKAYLQGGIIVYYYGSNDISVASYGHGYLTIYNNTTGKNDQLAVPAYGTIAVPSPLNASALYYIFAHNNNSGTMLIDATTIQEANGVTLSVGGAGDDGTFVKTVGGVPDKSYLLIGAFITTPAGSINLLNSGSLVGGSGYNNGVYKSVPLTVQSGTVGGAATADITVSGGSVTLVQIVNHGYSYDTTSVLTCSHNDISYSGSGSGFLINVASVYGATTAALLPNAMYTGGVFIRSMFNETPISLSNATNTDGAPRNFNNAVSVLYLPGDNVNVSASSYKAINASGEPGISAMVSINSLNLPTFTISGKSILNAAVNTAAIPASANAFVCGSYVNSGQVTSETVTFSSSVNGVPTATSTQQLMNINIVPTKALNRP